MLQGRLLPCDDEGKGYCGHSLHSTLDTWMRENCSHAYHSMACERGVGAIVPAAGSNTSFIIKDRLWSAISKLETDPDVSVVQAKELRDRRAKLAAERKEERVTSGGDTSGYQAKHKAMLEAAEEAKRQLAAQPAGQRRRNDAAARARAAAEASNPGEAERRLLVKSLTYLEYQRQLLRLLKSTEVTAGQIRDMNKA